MVGEGVQVRIGVKVRFEVFKRDRFTCTYCGGHPPDVLLEVDHVIPKAAGGSDDIENLVTACADCNRGKSDRLLDEAGHPIVGKRTVAALEERLEQARAYMDLITQMSNVTQAMVDRLYEEWARAFEATRGERDGKAVWLLNSAVGWPKEATLREFLAELDIDKIVNAMDIAANRIGTARGADRYFYAICWRMIRDKQVSRNPDDEEFTWALEQDNKRLREEIVQLRADLAEAGELIEDLRINIRRLREEAGRE